VLPSARFYAPAIVTRSMTTQPSVKSGPLPACPHRVSRRTPLGKAKDLAGARRIARMYTRSMTAQAPIDTHELRAMEVRGGNDAANDRLSVWGFEAYIYALPHNNEPHGGDLRVVSTCAMGQIVRFTLADLAGHGSEAGDMALRLRSLMRKNVNMPNPTLFARALNKEFVRMAEGGRFATAIITTYFAPTDHLIVCNAGHPRPLLYHAPAYESGPNDPRTWQLFDQSSSCVISAENVKNTGISNLPLGIIQQTDYPQFATRLVAGDILLSYTDALIEASDLAGNQLGEQGLLGVVRRLGVDGLTPDQIGPAILEAVAAHRAGKPADDDVTLLVMYHTATNPPDGVWDRLKALGRLVGLVG